MTIRKFDQIDSLRFFAVFAVICGHWGSSFTKYFEMMTSTSRGVDLFFVISGFLITLGLLRSKDKAPTIGNALYKFYIRRFLRIFPIYYLTVFILYCFYHGQMGSIWWYLLYLCNFHSIRMQDWGVAGHFWSLSVEEQFYLVWPFIILLTPTRHLVTVIIASVFISLAAKSYWVFHNVPFWSAYMNPLSALDALALGGLLAYLYTFHEARLKTVLYNPFVMVIVILQMVFCIYCFYVPGYSFIHNIGIRTSFGLFSMWLIGRATFGFTGVVGYILDSRPLRYIGKISYAIYLFHPFVPQMLHQFTYPENQNLRFLLYAVVTIGLASASWYLFEAPILKFKERFE